MGDCFLLIKSIYVRSLIYELTILDIANFIINIYNLIRIK
jgi:hypothetical protein